MNHAEDRHAFHDQLRAFLKDKLPVRLPAA
jgi:hypothetical protein